MVNLIQLYQCYSYATLLNLCLHYPLHVVVFICGIIQFIASETNLNLLKILDIRLLNN